MTPLHTPKKINVFQLVGCIMILIGTSIGAGMLALPLSSAQATFPLAIVVLVVSWFVMTVTGLLILEVNLHFPRYHNHFHSMTRNTIGRSGQLITWICCIGLFYSVISAYISGNASLLINAIQNISGQVLPTWSSAVLFTLVVAIIVARGARGVDLVNRGLMSVKGLLLIGMLACLMPHINLQQLSGHTSQSFSFHLSSIAFGAPIFLFGFGYHAVIPSLVNYIGPDKRNMRIIIITGTSFALLIYILWLTVSFGIIPATGTHSFAELSMHGLHLPEFLADLNALVNSHLAHLLINSFADIAMTTSCLGVSLGLFDFLADGLKVSNNPQHRYTALGLTFLPPLLTTIIFPHFFLIGLSIGAIFVIILEILIPAAMVYRFRQQPSRAGSYRVSGGQAMIWLTVVIGLIFLACAIAAKFHH